MVLVLSQDCVAGFVGDADLRLMVGIAIAEITDDLKFTNTALGVNPITSRLENDKANKAHEAQRRNERDNPSESNHL